MGGTIYWVGEVSHFEGLSYGLRGFSDSLNFDLMSHALSACPESIRKFCEAYFTYDGVTGLEARVEVNRILVMSLVVPVLLPGFISRHHHSKVNC